MQRRLRFLTFALTAGFIAVFAAALPMLATGAMAPATQIQYVTSTRVDLPGIVKMFMHGAGSTSETKTVSSIRTRDDNGDTSTIVACDLKRVIHLDNKAKTYYSLTFDEMVQQMLAVQKAMASKVRGMQTPPPSGTMPPIKGSGDITLSVSDQPDGQTKTILGMTAHHDVETLSVKGTGTGDCASFSGSMTTEQWYIPNELPTLACSLPMPPALANMPRPGAPPNPMAGNPCMSKFNVEAHAKSHADRFALQESVTMNLGGGHFTTHTDITSYTKMPYDPKFFDVPAGYTQIQPPPPPMPR